MHLCARSRHLSESDPWQSLKDLLDGDLILEFRLIPGAQSGGSTMSPLGMHRFFSDSNPELGGSQPSPELFFFFNAFRGSAVVATKPRKDRPAWLKDTTKGWFTSK